jgi:uridine kinase
MCDLKIWTDCSEYVCALRRFIKFTCKIKGYSSDYVYNQCIKYVIPGQEKYVKPARHICDLTVSGEKESEKIDQAYFDMIKSFILNCK